MNRKFLSYASLFIILVFIGYMIYDSVRPAEPAEKPAASILDEIQMEDAWEISGEIQVTQGKLNAVAAGPDGKIFAAGDSFVSSYRDESGTSDWTFKAPSPVTSIAVYGDSVFASTLDQIMVISGGKLLNEWGPFESNCIITSVSVTRSRVAFCDAGNRKVYILDRGGEVVSMAGQNDPQFVLPSAYFDVALNDDNSFWVANPGRRRIEKRSSEGAIDSFFGEAGLAPEAFCGCCNPSHFAVIPGGFVTAEKGVNRIKILNENGEFIEFVSSRNNFIPATPLDLASADGKIIYAANSADSKIYIFKKPLPKPLP